MNLIRLCFILFVWSLQSCSGAAVKGQSTSVAETPDEAVPEKYSAEEKRSILDDMKKSMNGFVEEKGVSNLSDAKLQLQLLSIAWHDCYGKLVEAKGDSEIWGMRDSAIAVLAKYQTKMFPKFRKVFSEETNKRLWIQDCSAFISGQKNEVLNLVGLAFAPNRYKQESYDTLKDVLKEYRFKKLTFRAFESSNNITSYDIGSDDDTSYLSLMGE